MRLDHLLSRERELVPFGVAPALTPSQVDRPILVECPLGGTRVFRFAGARSWRPSKLTPNISLAKPKVGFLPLFKCWGAAGSVRQDDSPGGPGGRLAQLVRALP